MPATMDPAQVKAKKKIPVVKETATSIAAMRDVVFELGRQQAVTNSKINSLEEWKRMIDTAKRQ